MILQKVYPFEHYHCRNCDKHYTEKQMNEIRWQDDYPIEKWICPDCSENLWIYVQDGSGKKAHKLIIERKQVKELEQGDEIVFRKVEIAIHKIKNVPSYTDKGEVYITFSDYRWKHLPPEKWVNCYVKNWDGDTSKFK